MNDSKNILSKRFSRFNRISRYGIAAAAILILLLFCYWLYTFYTLSSNKLYSENFSDYELTTLRDTSSRSETSIEKAYHEKNYDEVIRLHAISVLSAKEIFLTGLSYLQVNDPANAISSFQVVLADMNKYKPFSLKDETEYYLALAYLKNRDFDQSIELMNKIHDNPVHLYKNKFPAKFISRVKMLKWR